MNAGLSGSMVFDTGVLLELAVDSPKAKEVKDGIIEHRLQPATGELNVMEMSYILCRKLGKDKAAEAVRYLRGAKQFRILSASLSFLSRAAEIKCTRSISLVDCVTISMGELLKMPVLFAKSEKEFDRELARSGFETRLIFLG
jgi:predicted nucleic acid-binding protein